MKTTLQLLAGLCLFVSCHQGVEVGENGVGSWNKPRWISDALKAVGSGRWPRVKALSYWHERWKNHDGTYSDLRIDSSTKSKSAYQEGVKHPGFISEPQYLLWGGMLRLDSPEKGIYLGAFPGFGSTEDVVTESTLRDFEKMAGHAVTWAYFSDNWYHSIQFPSVSVAKIKAAGRMPFIRMMMRSEDNQLPDSKYRLQQIVDGKFDPELHKWAQEAKLTQLPIMVEFGTEVNGDWFPWNGRWNGEAQGAERFKASFRRIVDIFREEEAYNVTWAFHVDANSSPNAPWNSIAAYYPGDDYVDWIGLSVYGPQRPTESAGNSFASKLDLVYPQITALSDGKPIAILEWGIAEPSSHFPTDDDRRSVVLK